MPPGTPRDSPRQPAPRVLRFAAALRVTRRVPRRGGGRRPEAYFRSSLTGWITTTTRRINANVDGDRRSRHCSPTSTHDPGRPGTSQQPASFRLISVLEWTHRSSEPIDRGPRLPLNRRGCRRRFRGLACTGFMVCCKRVNQDEKYRASAAGPRWSHRAVVAGARTARDWKATSSASGAARTATSSARRSARTPRTRRPSTSSRPSPTGLTARATSTWAYRRGTHESGQSPRQHTGRAARPGTAGGTRGAHSLFDTGRRYKHH